MVHRLFGLIVEPQARRDFLHVVVSLAVGHLSKGTHIQSHAPCGACKADGMSDMDCGIIAGDILDAAGGC